MGPRHAGSAKLTLGRTSEITPKAGVPFSLLACTAWEASRAHRFHRECLKSPKSAQNGVPPPLFLTSFSGSLHKCTPHIRRFLEKSAGFPPADGPAGGGPHFSPKICENEGCIYVSFLKNWSKRGVPPRGFIPGPPSPHLVPLYFFCRCEYDPQNPYYFNAAPILGLK